MSDLISYGFLTPPAVLILLSLVGALHALRWREFGVALLILFSAALDLLATPLVASSLLHQVELGIPESSDWTAAQASLGLGAGARLEHRGIARQRPRAARDDRHALLPASLLMRAG